MFQQRALDFKRPDAVTGTLDDVVLAPDEPEIPVGVAFGAVSREVPVALEVRRHLLWVQPIFTEQADRTVRLHADGYFAFLARRHLAPVIIQQRHGKARGGLAHRTG